MLPEWTHDVFPEKLFPLSALSFATRTYTPELARLQSGPLLREILEHMELKTMEDLSQNFWVYSAHDTTVANMLNTLGLLKPLGYHNPPFAATVMIELRQFLDRFNVQVFYKNSTAEPKPLNIPGCGTSCPLNQFVMIYRSLVPLDWDRECQLSIFEQPIFIDENNSFSYFAIVSAFFAVVFAIIVVYVTVKLAYRK